MSQGGCETRRRVIVNADDFGLSQGVNRAILAAHERGIVTSASLMVRRAAAASAVASSSAYPRLSLGLHLDLGEWRFDAGRWEPLYEVVALEDAAAVAAEARRQIEQFQALVGRNPTHLDSHQHVHCRESVSSVALQLARELGVPLRHFSPEIAYCGDFFGQTTEGVPIPGAIAVDALIRILSSLKSGITELACHPGEALDEKCGDTMYRSERGEEVGTLCDPRVRAACVANGIELCSFADVVTYPVTLPLVSRLNGSPASRRAVSHRQRPA